MSEGAIELPVTVARERLTEVVNAAAYRGTVTYVTRRGKRLAAIVPVDDAEEIERSRRSGERGSGLRLRTLLAAHRPDPTWAHEVQEVRELVTDEESAWPTDD
jgi:prevent-host-death family protein